MNKYTFDFKEGIPKYMQVEKHIKYLMEQGKISHGEKLPAIRDLSTLLCVNKTTIINAYEKLKLEGLAELKVGSGTYAKKKELSLNFKRIYNKTFKKITSEKIKEYIDFTGEAACSKFFPVEKFKEVIDEVLDRDGADALTYLDSSGYEGLRKSIGEIFWSGKINKDRILIVTGAQQGIDLISKFMLNVNDGVIVEKPTYSGALSVFTGRRANIFDIPMEHDGIDINMMEKILKGNKVKCFYTMSYFQNPTGITTSLEKKKAILNLARIYDFYIIEDDYLSDMKYDDNMEYSSYKGLDTSDRVFYVKSFSKIFLPGIRIGYLIPPKKYLENMQSYKISADISTSTLMQRALQLYMERGYFFLYIDKLRKIYKKKYYYMKNMINSILGDYVEFLAPEGGFSFYLKIKNNMSCTELFNRCLEKKIIISPGVLYYIHEEEGKNYFKLAYSEIDEKQVEKGLLAIRDCFN